jgi:para-aminobenzoate synthetase component 2
MILVIDNYDSFVFNLSRYVEELGKEALVVRNDKITIDEIYRLQPTHIIISPGPCGPEDAGISIKTVKEFYGKIPILGICLGHQVIGHVFGGQVIKAKKPMHGKSCFIHHNSTGIFNNIPSPISVGRYHSLIVSEKNLSTDINVTSRSPEGEIMSFGNNKLKIFGFQFHPESVLTEHGHLLINNFISYEHMARLTKPYVVPATFPN